jgi:hypothetical protein
MALVSKRTTTTKNPNFFGPGHGDAEFWTVWSVCAGIESFSKLGDSIYFEERGERPALYVVQFIPSTFSWRTAGLTVAQQLMPLSSSDQYLQVSFSVSAKVKSAWHKHYLEAFS